MILVDTSVWVDHLRKGDSAMRELLDQRRVLSHPMVIGELALGHLNPREQILALFHLIPRAVVASHPEVIQFISTHRLYGRGLGLVDAHLLAAVKLTPNASLWTRDKRLAGIARSLSVAHSWA